MKYTEHNVASWLYHGWGRRWLKRGSDQTDERIFSRLRTAHNRMIKAQNAQEQAPSDFRWCPECMECRKHRPGADQCMACDRKAAQAGKDVNK